MLGRLITPFVAQPHPVDWISDPDGDDDESSAQGFNEPTSFEPGDEEGEEDEEDE